VRARAGGIVIALLMARLQGSRLGRAGVTFFRRTAPCLDASFVTSGIRVELGNPRVHDLCHRGGHRDPRTIHAA
jgi:hypothetical protein